MAEPDLILVRHGATEWSETGQHTSQTDIGLTEAGRAEARRLRGWLQTQRPAAVWTSPLRRARETAQACGYAEAEIVDALREWNYGDYEGLTTPEIQYASPGWTVFEYGGAGPEGETPEAVAQRVDALLARVRQVPGRPVLMFAHGHILRALTARWLGQPVQFGARLHLDSGSICLLGKEHELKAVLSWNVRQPVTD
ncbi:histidine phosphatase family protein [Acidihalobacter ferrooxydans]|uniref:Histidine phosphatase family protein n=1 Tax=Acidihalobacter ferrooxydans TaxID=1765967 RepID=A0A1P8UK34_9GAMM|nr:histidine phosphatase family protein [Acidihalobacter ferrooxydans]APZ44132.1 hypothetical protein BW247_14380 [Acidihalobacter ferrooxydans]